MTNGHLHALDAETGDALPNVWAIGDAVGTVMRGQNNPVATSLPATAQVANQMGNVCSVLCLGFSSSYSWCEVVTFC